MIHPKEADLAKMDDDAYVKITVREMKNAIWYYEQYTLLEEVSKEQEYLIGDLSQENILLYEHADKQKDALDRLNTYSKRWRRATIITGLAFLTTIVIRNIP